MTFTTAAGYSGTPLIRKLGIKEGSRVLAIGEPPEYARILGDLPSGASFVRRANPTVDLAHLFAVRRADLARHLKKLRASLRSDAVVWVSWPKKSARVPTDITEDVIRDVALPMGFVDVKVCAVTDVWSGLKLVVRKELRRATS
ncbi:MAG TPA: DUF3052 domain-containing protein [Gemmatimonadaceae bacterium]|nr:DUF3052 domain-containing protein [Gemmatimonadaceae bacterium]